MRSDEAYRACLDGKRVELQGEEVVIDNAGILCWKNSGKGVLIAPETLCDWELFKPAKPSEPETEEVPVAIDEFGYLHVRLTGTGIWNLAHVLTHRNFVRLNYVLPDGTKLSFPNARCDIVPTKLWWNIDVEARSGEGYIAWIFYPGFEHGYTIPVLPSSVTMLVDKEKVQNERGHNSRD